MMVGLLVGSGLPLSTQESLACKFAAFFLLLLAKITRIFRCVAQWY